MDYPPAKHALFELRQHRECQMLAGIFAWEQIHEWVAVNGYLADDDILKFYDELTWLESDVYEICSTIRFLAMKNFVDAKRYSDYRRAVSAAIEKRTISAIWNANVFNNFGGGDLLFSAVARKMTAKCGSGGLQRRRFQPVGHSKLCASRSGNARSIL
jgi:hypothetical protein